jgi:choline dehydrogenase-like flavoprotein
MAVFFAPGWARTARVTPFAAVRSKAPNADWAEFARIFSLDWLKFLHSAGVMFTPKHFHGFCKAGIVLSHPGRKVSRSGFFDFAALRSE